ncbi:nitric oxide reductase transcriptional regulator NorR [Aquabacterium sp.]|uniref:nitric oxide reductase transcriptional regulator NorR n=1 Tax=Aquabacterium sp. TaxID=1872578 RepID=UPI003D6D4BC5
MKLTFETPLAPYQRLLSAARALVRCDAAALLRLDHDMLVPVAIDGLSEDTMGRRFAVARHPRLSQLLSSVQGLRFPPDCNLPDPYDGLVAGHPDILPVHDCMGAPLMVGGRLWGLVTLDALTPGALGDVSPGQLQALKAMLEDGIEKQDTIGALAERAEREQAVSRALLQTSQQPRQLLGHSDALQQLLRDIDIVAPSDLTVLVLGETGVGKELVAQQLHAQSGRRERPLIQLNCAALPDTLADSELFGHKRGAFTGAVQDRVGKFELADGGTLFLDEVGELSPTVQAKLLRVLQSGELQRPGSDKALRVDVRVIAATNRDLKQEVSQGRFRVDLYHRLSVYPLHVPPLRERGRDVLTLAGGFLEENQHRLGARNLRLSPQAKAALLAYDWPGNVRELEHLVNRAALRALSEQGRGARWVAIEAAHLGLDVQAMAAEGSAAKPDDSTGWMAPIGESLRAATDAFQRRWIVAALKRHGGAMAAAAREAGMDRSNFHRLAARLGVKTN